MKSKDSARLIVQAPDASRHADMLDLVAKTFSTWHGYWQFLAHCRKGYMDRSHYHAAASRIGLLDGKVVTNWSVYDYRMRIGRSTVRVGGVGVVATHGEFRRRGLMIPTGMGSVRAMGDLGYDVTLLFGLHNFYHQFGYVRAWSDSSYAVAAADLPTGTVAPALRKFSPPRKDMDALYNRYCQGLTGTAVRPTYLVNRPGPGGQPSASGYFWTGKGSAAVGYVVVNAHGTCLDCAEAIGQPATVLAALGKLAKQFHASEIRLGGLPYDSPLAVSLRRLTCRMDTQFVRNGAAMIRMINLRSTLGKIAPELSRRLAASHLNGWKGRLLIADPREKVVLEIDRSKVALAASGTADAPHSVRGGEHVAQLLIGTDEPGEVVEAGGIRLRGDAKTLVPVLFPNQRPALSAWDHF